MKKQSIRANKLVTNRVNAVSTPLAQSTTLCGLVDTSDATYSRLNTQLELLTKHGLSVLAVARLQLFHGLRISEVLSITGNDIDRFSGIIIRGKKGSSPRKVIDSELHTFWLSKRLLGSEKVFEFDRYYIYRLYKSVGINHSVEGKTNKTVTHFPRHLYIKEVQNSLNDIEKTALVIGHKNSKSTKGYLKSKIK